MKRLDLKKKIKLFLLAIIAIVGITSIVGVEAATTAPSTLTMGQGKSLGGYVAGTYFSTKVTSDGKYAYCTNIHLSTPNNMKMTLVESKDAGIAYIIKNGFPAKHFTGNNNYDYYITQTALWWYLDDTAGGTNLSNSFKTNGSDPYGLRKHIKALVNAAKSARSAGYTKPSVSLSSSSNSLTISSDGKYYYSDYVTVTGKSTAGKIPVSISGAPSGSVLVNTSGSAKTSFASGEKFRIRVPASAVSSLQYAITLSASATGSVSKAYLYKPADSRYQPVVIGVLYDETSTVKTSKNFTLKVTKVSILKTDSETGKALAGAKMQLKNSSGKVVAEWTTTSKAYEIKNLPAGNYKLSEVEAPKGYKLNTSELDVVLTAGVVTNVTFYNTKKEPTNVVIIKRDAETNETLEGATFAIKDMNGKVITTWTSTKNGHYISGLPEGEYIIEEISAPKGYLISETEKKVVLESGKTVTVTFYDQEIKGDIAITKVDGETGERLAGAVLVLKDANGEEVARWTTTDEAYIIEKLKPGKYYLSEESAPTGYVLSTEVVEIEINENGDTQIVTFYNIPEVEVPNTDSSIPKMAIIIGAVTMVLGGAIVYKNVKKEN